jgi:hypothetical protein
MPPKVKENLQFDEEADHELTETCVVLLKYMSGQAHARKSLDDSQAIPARRETVEAVFILQPANKRQARKRSRIPNNDRAV